ESSRGRQPRPAIRPTAGITRAFARNPSPSRTRLPKHTYSVLKSKPPALGPAVCFRLGADYLFALLAAPFAAPLAALFAAPLAAPFAAPLAALFAAPLAAPFAAPLAAPFTAPFSAPFAAPLAALFAAPLAALFSTPFAAPFAAPVCAGLICPDCVPDVLPSLTSSAVFWGARYRCAGTIVPTALCIPGGESVMYNTANSAATAATPPPIKRLRLPKPLLCSLM